MVLTATCKNMPKGAGGGVFYVPFDKVHNIERPLLFLRAANIWKVNNTVKNTMLCLHSIKVTPIWSEYLSINIFKKCPFSSRKNPFLNTIEISSKKVLLYFYTCCDIQTYIRRRLKYKSTQHRHACVKFTI